MLYGSAFDLQREGQKAVFDYDPTADEGDGSDTRVYIVDSGVLSTHPEFSGRYGGLIYDPHSGSPGQHGMTCATLALGLTMGVAPGATVMDVRSFPETGGTSTSNIISGLNACISSHNSGSVPGVVNCSFGAVETSDPFNAPVEACVDAGLLLVAAAGNRQLDLTTGTNEWPAENPDAITVGGHDKQYKIHPFSNRFGEVDLYAPYHGHTPANPSGGFVGHMSWRGTSFSAPMAAGMIARMMTGAAKLTTRAEVQSLRAEFMSKYTVAGVRERDGSELLNVRRLYIPGVTFTGFSAETPPARGVS
jgi:subtilisin family serine protease